MSSERPAFAEAPPPEKKPAAGEAAKDANREEVMRRESFELNGARVEFLGIGHNPETAERFAPELEKAIRRASIVLLESAPNAEGPFTDEAIREYRELMGNKLKLSDEEIIKSVEAGKRGLAFYAKMETLAAKHGKPVAVADPIGADGDGFRELFAEDPFRSADETAGQAKTAAILAGALVAALPTISDAIRGRSAQNENRRESTPAASVPPAEHPADEPEHRPPGGPPMSRRRFLRVLGGGIAAAGMAAETASAIARKSNPAKGSYGRRGDNPFGAALYDGLDYRDVVTAQGLDRLTRRKDIRGGSVVIIYGDGHRASIRHYAESPNERALKRTAYIPYQRVAPAKLRIFQHRSGRDWQRVHEEEL